MSCTLHTRLVLLLTALFIFGGTLLSVGGTAGQGHEVLAVDIEERLVDEIRDEVTHAAISDGTDKRVLEELRSSGGQRLYSYQHPSAYFGKAASLRRPCDYACS